MLISLKEKNISKDFFFSSPLFSILNFSFPSPPAFSSRCQTMMRGSIFISRVPHDLFQKQASSCLHPTDSKNKGPTPFKKTRDQLPSHNNNYHLSHLRKGKGFWEWGRTRSKCWGTCPTKEGLSVWSFQIRKNDWETHTNTHLRLLWVAYKLVWGAEKLNTRSSPPLSQCCAL